MSAPDRAEPRASTEDAGHTCALFIRSKADATGLDLIVTEVEPTVTYPEFPTSKVRCPHGVAFWTLPTPDEAERLRAMNNGGIPPAVTDSEVGR